MFEKIKKCILSGKYYSAKEMCNKYSDHELMDNIMDFAYETESISAFDFAQFMWYETKTVGWIEVIVKLMLNPLCFVEGAYSVALFYAREMLKIEYSIENLEQLLFFYELPEAILEREEADNIIKNLLELDPQNHIALECFKKLHD